MNAKTQRTPGPWASEWTNRFHKIRVFAANNRCVATLDGTDEENKANAAFIVTACNAHDELVAALYAIRLRAEVAAGAMHMKGALLNIVDQCDAALAKVTP